MTCKSIRFTWYDDCGVAAVTSIVPVCDFAVTLVEGIKEMKVGHYRKLLNGSILLDELQSIQDSVKIGCFLFSPSQRYFLQEDELYSLLSSENVELLQSRLFVFLESIGVPEHLYKEGIPDNASRNDETN